MSVKVMALVYEAKLGSPTRKAIALKLADHADNEGGSIFPTIARIARETEVSDRTVQRTISDFLREGLLAVVRRGGGRPGSSTHYRIDLTVLARMPRTGDRVSPLTGDTDAETGDTVTPKPSVKPSLVKPSARQPDRFSPGAGDRLIPFSGTDAASIIGEGKKAAQAQLKGKEPKFSRDVLRQVAMLGVQVEPLVERFMRKTKGGQGIKDHSGYLLTMARDQAAKDQGVSVETLKQIASTDAQESAEAIASQAIEADIVAALKSRPVARPSRELSALLDRQSAGRLVRA